MHYSLSLVGKTVIFYHALTRVLGNDKRLSVELPLDPLSSTLSIFHNVRHN
jgi:hypothetical protein